ncbi:MAG: trigger factor family protein [Oscillochloris sp.]|nr:trigger factor family protein [Oscillochloris sp.]
MKITTEKLPKSILSLQIELDGPRLERGLDQAARRLSKRFPIHGFRPGKAPRFMIERTYGRDALIEEASEDLINKAYRDALTQEKIEPVGPPRLEGVSSSDPFIFTVSIPIAPTVNIGDYRAIRGELEIAEVDAEQVDRAMDVLRDKHVVLKELDEPRPAQEGDQLKVQLLELVDGKPLAQLDDEEDGRRRR